MCYAIPGKIIELNGKTAIVDYFGEHRTAANEFNDAKVGDYVYAQGGIIVQKIPEKDALLILEEWKELFFKLKKVDDNISKTKKQGPSGTEFKKILEKAEQGKTLSKEEAIQLLKIKDKNELELLFSTANKIRQVHLKNSCCVHGIIEFSNYCRNNCSYCGIRNENATLQRYRIDTDEIVDIADNAVNKLGFKALVLQSGENVWYTTEKLVEIIKRIKQKCGVLLFMSVGSRDRDCYTAMYEAGARGILLRFETSNSELYAKIHSGPKADFQHRIELLKHAAKLGYIIATGSLVGLPGQTEEDLINDILLTKSLETEMYSFGPLIPNPKTPLANAPLTNINTVLKVIAISRLLDPNAKVLVTTALDTLDKNGKKQGLLAGANSLMINITPKKYKNLYAIYPNRAGSDDVEKAINVTLKLLYSLGRAPTDLGR